MAQYASNTTVSPEKTQNDIKETLRRYGAVRFGILEEATKAHVMFEFDKLMIQLSVSLPNKEDFIKTEAGRSRKKKAADDAYNQAIRQRWRALLLAIKAKLEAVETGISTLEKEFLAFVVLPDGQSVGDHLIPEIKRIAGTGKMPQLLPYSRERNV